MKKIKDLRSEYKISQRELAEAIKVTQASISRWEKNQKSISGANLIKLSQYFNVSVDELLGYMGGRTMRLNNNMNDDFSDEDEFKDYFRERLIFMMTEKNLGINELASKSRVSIDTIEMCLSIHRWVPLVIDFLHICDALECTPSDLLGY